MHKFSLLNPHPVAPAVVPAAVKAAAAAPAAPTSCIGTGIPDPFGARDLKGVLLDLVDGNYDKSNLNNTTYSANNQYTAGTGATIMGQTASNNKCPALVLSCIDFRSQDDVLRDLTKGQIYYTVPRTTLNPTTGNKKVVFSDETSRPTWLSAADATLFNNVDKYDEIMLAGSSLGYNTALNFTDASYSSASFQKEVSDPSTNIWANLFNQHLDIAVLLHDVTNIIIVDHMECGAYKAFYSKQYAVEGRTKGKDLWVPPHLINMDRSQDLIKTYYNSLYRPYKYDNKSNVIVNITWKNGSQLALGSVSVDKSRPVLNNGVPIGASGILNVFDNSNTVLELINNELTGEYGIRLASTRILRAYDRTIITNEFVLRIPQTNYELVFDFSNFPTLLPRTCTIQRIALKFYYFILDTDGNLVSYNSEPTRTQQDQDRSKPSYGFIA
jgi:hypothetical protein